jgi:putative sterol carrier protein
MTPLVAFSTAWASAWCRLLNSSAVYRQVAAQWEGSVALVLHYPGADPASGPGAAVFLDLHHGSCRQARVATAEDLASAAFVLEAEQDLWRQLLAGQGSPVMALMTGRLRLTRGDFSRLLPYAEAAKELLALVSQIETVFDDS